MKKKLSLYDELSLLLSTAASYSQASALASSTPHTTSSAKRELERKGIYEEEYRIAKQLCKDDFISSVPVTIDLKKLQTGAMRRMRSRSKRKLARLYRQ